MKIFLGTFFFILVLLLDSVELSSLRSRRPQVHPEPSLYPDIHFYENGSGERVSIPPGRHEVGLHRCLIVGIVIDHLLRPVFDAEGYQVVVNTNFDPIYNVRQNEHYFARFSYGETPRHTAIAIIPERN